MTPDEAHDVLIRQGNKTVSVARSIAATARPLLVQEEPAYFRELLEAQADDLRRIAGALEGLARRVH